MTTDQLAEIQQRAVIAAHDADCDRPCGGDVSTYRPLDRREQAVLDVGLAAVRDAQQRALRAEQALEEAIGILNDLTDPDDCWYDHHGYCQAHGWTDTDPACPHRRAKDVSALDGGQDGGGHA